MLETLASSQGSSGMQPFHSLGTIDASINGDSVHDKQALLWRRARLLYTQGTFETGVMEGYKGFLDYFTTLAKPTEDVIIEPLDQIVEQERIKKKIKILFYQAKGQDFEDGMESGFSRDLVSLIKTYGDVAVEAIAGLTLSAEIDSEVMGEALHRLGSIDHPQTQLSRLELLFQCLESPSADVRDGAVVGIAFLDNLRAIPFLKQSIQQEKHAGLRADMQQVIEQLEETLASDTKDVAK